MPDREKVIKGLDVCLKNIDQPDCPNDCPYLSGCSEYENRVVFQPLMRDALALLNAQKDRHRLEVHNIGNVDIPEGVSEEHFHLVMNNVVEALQHTDKGESYPYEDTGR